MTSLSRQQLESQLFLAAENSKRQPWRGLCRRCIGPWVVGTLWGTSRQLKNWTIFSVQVFECLASKIFRIIWTETGPTSWTHLFQYAQMASKVLCPIIQILLGVFHRVGQETSEVANGHPSGDGETAPTSNFPSSLIKKSEPVYREVDGQTNQSKSTNELWKTFWALKCHVTLGARMTLGGGRAAAALLHRCHPEGCRDILQVNHQNRYGQVWFTAISWKYLGKTLKEYLKNRQPT